MCNEDDRPHYHPGQQARPVLMLLSSEPALMLAIRLMLMLTRPGLMLASNPAVLMLARPMLMLARAVLMLASEAAVLMLARAADQLEHHLLSA